jgi:hypothetical protein
MWGEEGFSAPEKSPMFIMRFSAGIPRAVPHQADLTRSPIAAEKVLDEGHGFTRAVKALRAKTALAAEVRFPIPVLYQGTTLVVPQTVQKYRALAPA